MGIQIPDDAEDEPMAADGNPPLTPNELYTDVNLEGTTIIDEGSESLNIPERDTPLAGDGSLPYTPEDMENLPRGRNNRAGALWKRDLDQNKKGDSEASMMRKVFSLIAKIRRHQMKLEDNLRMKNDPEGHKAVLKERRRQLGGAMGYGNRPKTQG